MVDKITNTKLQIIGLYRTNYLAHYHVREMAKLLKKNHATLLPHIAQLEKDRILVAKKSGRNKDFSLNLSNTLAKDYLCLAEKLETIFYLEKVFLIKKIAEEIDALGLSGSIVLFGSYAKKTYDEKSDIDLFYVGECHEKQMERIKDSGKQYNKVINIKKITPENFKKTLFAKDSLIHEILQNHILLLNPEFFITETWRYFNDIKQ